MKLMFRDDTFMSVGNRGSDVTGASNNLTTTATGNRETLSQILNQRKASSVSSSTASTSIEIP